MEEELNERPIVICSPAVPGYVPHVMGSTLAQCGGCGAAIWVSPDTIMIDAERVCINCVPEGIDPADIQTTEATKRRLHGMGVTEAELQLSGEHFVEWQRNRQNRLQQSDDD